MKLKYTPLRPILCIVFWILFTRLEAQESTASRNGIIIIDSIKAVRIQKELISIPVILQIIEYKDSIINLKDSRQKICEEKNQVFFIENSRLKYKIKLRRKKSITRSLFASIVILTQTYFLFK